MRDTPLSLGKKLNKAGNHVRIKLLESTSIKSYKVWPVTKN